MSNTTYSPSFKPSVAGNKPATDPLIEMFKATPLYILITALKGGAAKR